jgi:hypothetical protein
MGEIEDTGAFIDDDDAQGHQGIHHAHHQAGYRKL